MEDQPPPPPPPPPTPPRQANHSGNSTAGVEDAQPIKSLSDAWDVFLRDSKKLWAIAVPIGFSMICFYGINSVTQIFAGHLGNLELSAVAVGLSVIFVFSFGFLVSSN